MRWGKGDWLYFLVNSGNAYSSFNNVDIHCFSQIMANLFFLPHQWLVVSGGSQTQCSVKLSKRNKMNKGDKPFEKGCISFVNDNYSCYFWTVISVTDHMNPMLLTKENMADFWIFCSTITKLTIRDYFENFCADVLLSRTWANDQNAGTFMFITCLYFTVK